MSAVLAAADLHLIPARRLVASREPWCRARFTGILAAGKPFVAMMERHAEVARIAPLEARGGIRDAASGDAAALARTITRCIDDPALLDAMGRRARALAERSYDRPLDRRGGSPISSIRCVRVSPASRASMRSRARRRSRSTGWQRCRRSNAHPTFAIGRAGVSPALFLCAARRQDRMLPHHENTTAQSRNDRSRILYL